MSLSLKQAFIGIAESHREGFISSLQSHESLKWKQMWSTGFLYDGATTQRNANTASTLITNTHMQTGTTRCHAPPPFSIACPHLPPAGSRVNVAGVAQSCLIDEACDKQANWGGREDVLQRPAEHPTWQVMLFMPLYAFPASQSECSRKNRAELVFWRLRILVWGGGGGGGSQTALGFVSCFG